jgi:hypothetical protein
MATVTALAPAIAPARHRSTAAAGARTLQVRPPRSRGGPGGRDLER